MIHERIVRHLLSDTQTFVRIMEEDHQHVTSHATTICKVGNCSFLKALQIILERLEQPTPRMRRDYNANQRRHYEEWESNEEEYDMGVVHQVNRKKGRR